MKKVLLTVFAVMTLTAMSFGQKNSFHLGIGAEVGVPTGDLKDAAKTGFGGSVKALYGVTESGYITAQFGLLSHKTSTDLTNVLGQEGTWTVTPLLVGYRHNFKGFFVEPQLGTSSYKLKVGGGSSSESAFTWALGAGYMMKGFEAGLRYQSATKSGSTLSMIAFRVGYNFNLTAGGKK